MIARLPPAWRRPEIAVIAAIFAVGILLRVYFVVQWRPALVNYSDTGIYIWDAYSGGFADPLRTAGYGIFLIPLHAITPHMLFVVLVQHAMGLASAVILYKTLKRVGAPWPVAVIAMAIIVLGGTQIFLEHAILSEALFTFLLTLALYGAVRSSHGPVWWALFTGACVGLSVTVRGVGTILLVVFPLWLLFSARPRSRAALRAGAAAMASLAIIGGYIAWRHAETGLSGLTTNAAWNLYGRVAPFADCTQFTPPEGTRDLCEREPPDERDPLWNVEAYIFDPSSPAQELFGPPYEVSDVPDANGKLEAWSLAVIRSQPFDYVEAVWHDLIRLVDPNHPSDGDLSYDGLIGFLVRGVEGTGHNEAVDSWRDTYYTGDKYRFGDIGFLEFYERLTRVQYLLMVALLVLAVAAIWITPPPARAAARLMAMTAFALLIYPIATHAYDARFVIPALGPLFAAAALGGWGLYPPLARRTREYLTRPN